MQKQQIPAAAGIRCHSGKLSLNYNLDFLLVVSLHRGLFGTEDAVTGIAQTREYVVPIIESLVKGSQVDVYVGMFLLHDLHALG